MEATYQNLGPNAENPMLIVQVKDTATNGAVVINLGSAKLTNVPSGATVALTSGFMLSNTAETGTYTVEVYVWDGWSSPTALSEPVTSTTFTVD